MSRAERSAARLPPSFALTLAKMTAVMLVCGIVGPIFLLIYLTADLPDTGWMLGWGVAVTVLDVVVAVAISVGVTRTAQRRYRLATTGVQVRAQVMSTEQTGTRINDNPLVRLRLTADLPDESRRELAGRAVVPQTSLGLLDGRDLVVNVDPTTGDFDIDWSATAALHRHDAKVAVVAPRPVAERLAELDELMRGDLLSQDEYDASRRRILGEL